MQLNAHHQTPEVLVIDIKENNLDASNVRDFKERVQTMLGEHRKVIFDMSQVRFVDSSGLGGLISCLRLLNSRNGDLRLCNMSAAVRALFELMRMHRVFNIQPSIDDAVRSYS